MLLSVCLLVLAYLLGSLSGSLLLGARRGVDVRSHGSGNAGGTNALRTLGWRFALAVVAVDIGKGALAAGLALWLAPAQGPFAPLGLACAATLFAVAGHTWPIFYGFRGGKGAATLVGGLAVVWPAVLLPLLLVWLVCIGISGYVGLATVLAAAALLPLAWWPVPDPTRLAFALAALAFIAFTHRGNLARLAQGRESRFDRARVLVRLFKRRTT